MDKTEVSKRHTHKKKQAVTKQSKYLYRVEKNKKKNA